MKTAWELGQCERVQRCVIYECLTKIDFGKNIRVSVPHLIRQTPTTVSCLVVTFNVKEKVQTKFKNVLYSYFSSISVNDMICWKNDIWIKRFGELEMLIKSCRC